jgi:hypothetical protein
MSRIADPDHDLTGAKMEMRPSKVKMPACAGIFTFRVDAI